MPVAEVYRVYRVPTTSCPSLQTSSSSQHPDAPLRPAMEIPS